MAKLKGEITIEQREKARLRSQRYRKRNRELGKSLSSAAKRKQRIADYEWKKEHCYCVYGGCWNLAMMIGDKTLVYCKVHTLARRKQ